MAEPKYWAQPSQPGFGTRLGQALVGGLEGLKQGLAWKLAQRQQKEKTERDKMQQDFVNSLKEAEEKRQVWEHKEAIRKTEVAKKDREYFETVTRPYQEELQKHNLWLNEQVQSGKLTPDDAALNAQRFASAAQSRMKTKLMELEYEQEKVRTEEITTPGRGGLGFETPQGQQVWRQPPTVKELLRYNRATAEIKIKELIAEDKKPNITDERREQIANEILAINNKLGKERYSKNELINWTQETVIGRQETKIE